LPDKLNPFLAKDLTYLKLGSQITTIFLERIRDVEFEGFISGIIINFMAILLSRRVELLKSGF